MSSEALSTTEIRDLLAHLLAGAAGGTEKPWRARVGEVEALPIFSNVRCNWRIDPKGSAEQLHAIERAAAIVRAEHPYVI